ncbi:hypothetical protein PISL3812_04351 [Talaromyces islandicus]|uniref:Glc8 protein n=1 Tax=Talaromyces islandicus TaxID=28573 RepID=A0A0U1LVA5_TALIS|nr:hypothetical protein PISL3812_04351 [Talaromyces islandicus]
MPQNTRNSLSPSDPALPNPPLYRDSIPAHARFSLVSQQLVTTQLSPCAIPAFRLERVHIPIDFYPAALGSFAPCLPNMTASQGVAPVNSQSSEEVPKRPKGILKNSCSFTAATQLATSPEASAISPPALPADSAENKDITLQNTLQNAGRRSSSARRTSAGRRLSGISFSGDQSDDRSSHLKWDEANLYLAEQEKTAKMKIDEPKTPWAPSYDPSQDDHDEMQIEAQDRTLDAHDLVVDELDKKTEGGHSKNSVKDSEIPDFELGEPEENFHAAGPSAGESRIMRERSLSQNSNRSDKHVVVNNEESNRNDHLMTTEESEQKHREFEKRRKKHYEMKNIKDLLAHPEEVDKMEDDDDENDTGVPPMPDRKY